MNVAVYDTPFKTYIYSDNKFKEVVYSLQFLLRLEANTTTLANLLIAMMRDRSQKYPTKSEMIRVRDMLYGARLQSQVRRFGESVLIQFNITTIAAEFVEEPIAEEAIEFLAEILYHPLINQETFAEAKNRLTSRLNRILEQPMRLAIDQGFKYFGEGTPVAYSSQGDLEQIDQITLEDILKFHQQLLASPVFSIVVGANEAKTTNKAFKKYFKQQPEINLDKVFYHMRPASPRVLKIEKQVNQANLVKFYSTGIDVNEKDFTSLHMLSIILGQLPTSLLFQEVREKNSLTYSISSSLQSYDGMMMINTSLDSKDIDAANQLIDQQLERIKQGDFDQNLLDGAMKMLESSFASIEDDIYSIQNFIRTQIFTQSNFDIETHAQKYHQVTLPMIQTVAKQIHYLGEIQLVERSVNDENL